MSEIQPAVAVVDDEPQMRKALQRLLNSHGFRVVCYAGVTDFLAEFSTHPVDCLILDLHMPEISGFDLLLAMKTVNNPPPVVVITGQDEPGTEERTRELGASAFLRKPVDESAFLAAIEAATVSRGGKFPTIGTIHITPEFP
ncbi:MAG: response regulator [Luteolibacter sp.]